jgi:hypothetical protein
MFPFDAFDAAHEKLMRVFWLDLPDEQHHELLHRGSKEEEALEELMVVWRRIGEDRIQEIESYHERSRMADERGLRSGYTLGTGDYPDLDEVYFREHDAETQLRVDYKSLFVFGEITFRDYLVLSEVVWEAPAGIEHDQGPTRFLSSVARATRETPLDPRSRFGRLIQPLLPLMQAVDNSLGFYRDKFVIHVPADMLLSGGGGAIGTPLPFSMSYERRQEVEEAQLTRLAELVKQVEEEQGINLGAGDDPKPKLRKLSDMLDRLDDPETVKAVQSALKEWGAELPPAVGLARNLASMFEQWAVGLLDEFGLMQA